MWVKLTQILICDITVQFLIFRAKKCFCNGICPSCSQSETNNLVEAGIQCCKIEKNCSSFSELCNPAWLVPLYIPDAAIALYCEVVDSGIGSHIHSHRWCNMFYMWKLFFSAEAAIKYTTVKEKNRISRSVGEIIWLLSLSSLSHSSSFLSLSYQLPRVFCALYFFPLPSLIAASTCFFPKTACSQGVTVNHASAEERDLKTLPAFF